MNLRQDCNTIIQKSLACVRPDAAVCSALAGQSFGPGRLILVAVGKAAWPMANSAWATLEKKPDAGIIITKYGHSKGPVGNLEIWEAGHPIPDENTYAATSKALELTTNLSKQDTVLFLLSGGGSALFEKPLVSGSTLQDITKQLLSSGADIVEMNTIRKRLSAVKGGKFALQCAPAKVFSVVLSDIIGDPLDMIASGPAFPDKSTCSQAIEIAKKYSLQIPPSVMKLLGIETPKHLDNITTRVTGNVAGLCKATAAACEELGYQTVILTDSLNCQAREAGSFLAAIARYHQNTEHSVAFVAGGETIVKLTGSGKGGRNQEIALSAAEGIAGLKDTAVFSIGSDGTDGPTEAAGGFATGKTKAHLLAKGVSIYDTLQNNDAYSALALCDGLIVTGATGTNVNDVSVILIHRD